MVMLVWNVILKLIFPVRRCKSIKEVMTFPFLLESETCVTDTQHVVHALTFPLIEHCGNSCLDYPSPETENMVPNNVTSF